MTEALGRVRRAYQAAGDGDLAELIGLFDRDTVWRGVERGHLWWRRAPS
jgi:ketosteroid isomerase-like protein